MVRIAHFTEASLAGVNGIASSIRLLTRELERLGHENLVVSAGPLRGGGGRDGVLWLRSAPSGMGDFRWVLRPRRDIRERVRAWKPEVVHVHTPGPLGAAALAVAREFGLPAVYTYHTDMHGYAAHYYLPTAVIRAGTAFYGRHLPRAAGGGHGRGKYAAVEAANARIFEAAHVIIAPTATALRRCRTATAYADRVRAIPTPPACEVLGASGAAFRQRFGIAAGAAVVLFVGRLSAEKGIPLLLDAFALVRAATPVAVLVLAGPEARRLGLRRRVRKAGLAAHTVLTGTLSGAEVRAAYRAANVFAFPSQTDTQGIVLHEAAMAGLPIVMVDRSLAQGHPLAAAVRVTEPTPAALAAELRALLSAPAVAASHGRRGQELARAHTPERFAEQVLDAYRQAVTTVAVRG